MSIAKNVLLNSYSSMKKNQKDSDDFSHRKLTLKSQFLAPFDTSPPISKIQKSILGMLILSQKPF